jgi:hypothetical protein
LALGTWVRVKADPREHRDLHVLAAGKTGLDEDWTAELIAMGVFDLHTERTLMAGLFCCFDVECREEECRGPAHHPEEGSRGSERGVAAPGGGEV